MLIDLRFYSNLFQFLDILSIGDISKWRSYPYSRFNILGVFHEWMIQRLPETPVPMHIPMPTRHQHRFPRKEVMPKIRKVEKIICHFLCGETIGSLLLHLVTAFRNRILRQPRRHIWSGTSPGCSAHTPHRPHHRFYVCPSTTFAFKFLFHDFTYHLTNYLWTPLLQRYTQKTFLVIISMSYNNVFKNHPQR